MIWYGLMHLPHWNTAMFKPSHCGDTTTSKGPTTAFLFWLKFIAAAAPLPRQEFHHFCLGPPAHWYSMIQHDTAWYSMIQLQIGVVAAKVIFISFFHVTLGSLTPKSICSIPKLALKLLWSCHQYLEKDPGRVQKPYGSHHPLLSYLWSQFTKPSLVTSSRQSGIQTFGLLLVIATTYKLSHLERLAGCWVAAQVMGQHRWAKKMRQTWLDPNPPKKTLKLETELKALLRRKFLPWTHLVHGTKP